MKQLDVESSKQPAFVVRKDVKEQNDKYLPTFAPTKQIAANTLKGLAVSAYFRSQVYLNYREKFAVVKVQAPSIKDKLEREIEFNKLNKFVVDNNVEVLCTKGSLLFRIPN